MDILVSAGLLTQQCYKTFFHDFNFFDVTCIKLLISKLLGYLIILGSVGVKLPQIFKVSKARSAEGLALSMFFLECIGYSINFAVGFVNSWPFNTYGENILILFQNYILIALIILYNGGFNVKGVFTFGVLIGFLLVLLSGVVPMAILQILQTGSIAIFMVSRIPQIVTNYKNKSSGQLAFTTFLLNFVGSLARIFTTMQETKDTISLAGFILSAVLNFVILAQIVSYGAKPKRKSE